MKFKDKPLKSKCRIIGAIILPLIYIIFLLITRDLDFTAFLPFPFGIIVTLIQWVSFLFGGWSLAIIATIIYYSLIGFLLGMLVGYIVDKIKSRKQ